MMPTEIPGKAISLQQLEEMFASIESGPKWDMTKPMLWGHFFTHSEPSRLEAVVEKLEKYGLRFVKLYLSDKDFPEQPDMFWLHMEEVRVHTPESLDKRNNEFYIFANSENLDSYDGMDVGPAI
jgi:hypothetical protein